MPLPASGIAPVRGDAHYFGRLTSCIHRKVSCLALSGRCGWILEWVWVLLECCGGGAQGILSSLSPYVTVVPQSLRIRQWNVGAVTHSVAGL